MLFAAQMPDGTVHLLVAASVTLAAKQAGERYGARPDAIWVLEGARRVVLFPYPGKTGISTD
jgi:hypothetical protein